MEYTTYTLKPFDKNLAKRGNLCVVTSYDYSSGSISAENTDNFKGVGVCTYLTSNEFEIVIQNITCRFNSSGYSVYPKIEEYKLFMASTGKEVQRYGNAIKRTMNVITTKTDTGVVTDVKPYEEIPKRTTTDDDGSKNVIVTALNARDNFALQVLKGLLPLVPDMKNTDNDSRDFYCKIAYDWAANMMDNAAQYRATFKDDTTSSGSIEPITELETNTDKLLNNMLYTMEKAQYEDPATKDISERVIVPELTEVLTAQTTAIVTALGEVKTALQAQTTTLNNIKTAIENLELSPVINNNITIPENNGGE